jgi:hypothetical protein
MVRPQWGNRCVLTPHLEYGTGKVRPRTITVTGCSDSPLQARTIRPAPCCSSQGMERNTVERNILTVEPARLVLLRALGKDHCVGGINVANRAPVPHAVEKVRLSPNANGTDVLVAAEPDEVRSRYHLHQRIFPLCGRRGDGFAFRSPCPCISTDDQFKKPSNR